MRTLHAPSDCSTNHQQNEAGQSMKIVIWMNIPSHHQAGFFQALRQAGVDLLVRYYDKTHLEERCAQGWRKPILPSGEAYVEPDLSALNTIPDYKERIHIVPGYGAPFLRQLATLLSRESVEWAHWSECSHPGARWYLIYPRKRWYGRLVARHALGAFAQGILATNDFMRWGIPIERIAFLHYAPKACDRSAEPDRECMDFLAGRDAFLYLGAQYHRKAIDVLVKSFASIPEDERTRWALLMVGKDFSQGRYREMAHKLGLNGSVKFMEPVVSDRISTVLKCAKVFVLPSRYDGWGVVLNGFDPDILTAEQSFTFPKFEIVYTGGINLGHPDFTPLLDALQHLCKTGKMVSDNILVTFYGKGNERRLKRLFRHPFSHVIRNRGGVCRGESLERQRSALILLQTTVPGTGWMTSKIYEYLIARRPILAIPSDGDSIEKLIRETRSGVSCSTKDEIAAQLMVWYGEWKKTGTVAWHGNMQAIMKYSRKEQAKETAYLLENVLNGS